jgi:outer membrane protein assembly factor BamB
MGASGQIYACCPELIGGGSGNLIAVDLPSGKVLWESKDLNLLCGVAPVKDDRVYATGEAGIYGISQETGKRLWEFRHDGLNYQPVIGAEGTVYAVSEKQGCYALDGQTGKQLWHFHDPRDPQGSEEEEEETSWGAFHYRPAAISADGTICLLKPTRRYKSDYDNRHDDGVWQNYTVYGLDGLTGQKLWEFASEPESEDYSVVYDGESYNILAVGLEGTLYIGMPWAVCALEGQSGRSLWQAKVQGEPLQQAAIGSDGAVYVACAGGNIRALDGRTGQKIWDIRLTPTDSDREGDIIFTGPAVGADGTIYVSAWDHMARPKVRVDAVYALSAQDGKKVWDCKLEGSVSELAIGSDGTLYFGAGGRLHALWTTSGREADSAWPMLGQNAQRTGLSGKAAAHYLANRSTITERNRLRAEECQRKCTEMGKLLAEAGAAEAAEKKKWLGKKDFSHARELYKKAAELGSDEAATKLKQLTA